MADDLSTQSDTSMSASRTPETDDSSVSCPADLDQRLPNPLPDSLGKRLHELYSDNVTAKVLRASIDCLRNNVSATLSQVLPRHR